MVPALLVRLGELPLEIFLQIVEDFDVASLLELTCHDYSPINETIFLQPFFQVIFPNRKAFDNLKSYYQLHSDVGKDLWRPDCTDWQARLKSYLLKIAATEHWRDYYTYALGTLFYSGLFSTDEQAHSYHLLLFAVSQRPPGAKAFFHNYDTMVNRRRDIVAAQRYLLQSKRIQIFRFIDLIEKFPGMLKPIMDPGECPRREQDIVSRLRGVARKIDQSIKFGRNDPSIYLFCYGPTPFVPYARYLLLFLDTIARFPPLQHQDSAAGSTDHSELMQILRIDYVASQPRRGYPYPYPEAIKLRIVKATEGLTRFYTASSGRTALPVLRPCTKLQKVPQRCRHIENYCPQHSAQCRVVYPCRSLSFETPEKTQVVRTTNGLWPLAEEDIEWLTCFLESCVYMSKMYDAPWDDKNSVASMWRERIDTLANAASEY